MSQLEQLMSSTTPELDTKERENRIRHALAYAMSQLRSNLGALDALVDAMQNDASVEECVLAIEQCTNPSGATLVLTSRERERERREQIRSEGVNPFEKILLGTGKSVDDDDLGVIEGKGGGDRKPTFSLTGDDPFYAALAVAAIFFAWASAGGLSLH